MEKYQINPQKGETEELINFAPIKIEQNEIEYNLIIENKENMITFSINDKNQFPSVNYIKSMIFKEIIGLNLEFKNLNSPNDFYDYLKSLSDNKRISIKKGKNKISIILFADIALEQQIIEIELFQAKKNIDSNIKEICEELLYIRNKIKEIDNLENFKTKINEKIKEIDVLKNQNKNFIIEIDNLKNQNKDFKKVIEENLKEINLLKNENTELKKRIDNINNENKQLKEMNKIDMKYITSLTENIKNGNFNESDIIKNDEKGILFLEIEKKLNKKIIQLKKLYQATIDGGEPEIFHLKCDGIPNTLVLIKSKGLKRFGGFTTIPWQSEGEFKDNAYSKNFIFSLDNQKIYYGYNVYHNKNRGPCFGIGHDIGIIGNPLKDKSLYTLKCSYNYGEDYQPLSEYDGNDKLMAIEYEVFQVIFY